MHSFALHTDSSETESEGSLKQRCREIKSVCASHTHTKHTGLCKRLTPHRDFLSFRSPHKNKLIFPFNIHRDVPVTSSAPKCLVSCLGMGYWGRKTWKRTNSGLEVPYPSAFSTQLCRVPSSFSFSMYLFRSSETELTGGGKQSHVSSSYTNCPLIAEEQSRKPAWSLVCSAVICADLCDRSLIKLNSQKLRWYQQHQILLPQASRSHLNSTPMESCAFHLFYNTQKPQTHRWLWKPRDWSLLSAPRCARVSVQRTMRTQRFHHPKAVCAVGPHESLKFNCVFVGRFVTEGEINSSSFLIPILQSRT